MSKYNSTLKYVASTPRSQRKGRGARYYGSTIPSLPSAGGVSLSYVEANFVTLNTEQAISGIKDFTNGLKVGGLSVYKSQADTIYLDANLVVRGGVTAWGTNEQTAPNIFEGLPIDGTSIYWDNGVLKSSATSSGGINEEQLADYLTTNGYATQSWVTGKGYLTGITGTMVTNALGYTPVAQNTALTTASNNAIGYGYSEDGWGDFGPTIVFGSGSYRAALQSSGSNTNLRYGYTAGANSFTWKTIAFTSDIPTSLKNPNALSWSGYSSGNYDGSTAQNIALPTKLSQLTDDVVAGKYLPLTGISDWALASAKPTYTASEVGALMQDSSTTNADLDTILTSKEAVLKPFFQAITSNNVGSARKGVLRMSYNGSESQLLFDHYNRLLLYRTIGSNPKDWATIAFTSDIPTNLSQLTDDVVSGKYLSLAGGTISQSAYWSTKFKSTGQTSSAIAFEVANGNVGYLMYADGSKWQVTAQNWSATHTLLHSGNYSEYALPITGGTVNGDISLPNGNRLISPSGNIAGTRIFGDDTTNYRTILGTATLNTLLIGNSTLKFWKGAVSKEYEIIDTSMPSISFPKYIATGIGTTEQSGYKVTGNGIDATFGANDATGGAYIWVASYHALRFGTNGAERMRITAEGLVGIGNTNPVARLDVGGTILTTADLATTEWVSDSGQIKANCKGTSYWIGIGATSTGRAVIQGGNKGVGSIPLLLNPTAGNVAIGGTTASEKLHVYGNILATGGITAQNSSDRRLKRNIRKFNARKVLMSLGGVYQYEYIASEVQKNHIYEGTHFGLIYQHVKGTKLDVMCHEREDGFGTLNYIHPKFISLVAGATMENTTEIEKLKRENRELKERVKQLENRAA